MDYSKIMNGNLCMSVSCARAQQALSVTRSQSGVERALLAQGRERWAGERAMGKGESDGQRRERVGRGESDGQGRERVGGAEWSGVSPPSRAALAQLLRGLSQLSS